MLDAIALYFRYQSSRVTSLRIVTTDLDLLSCASRKGKTDSDLIRNALLLWNNVVLCAIFKRKEVRFRFLRQYAVFCVVLKSIDDFFFSCEFALRFINQITVWIDDSFFCVYLYASHHVESLRFSSEMRKLILFWCKRYIMNASSFRADVVCFAQCFANFFSESVVN